MTQSISDHLLSVLSASQRSRTCVPITERVSDCPFRTTKGCLLMRPPCAITACPILCRHDRHYVKRADSMTALADLRADMTQRLILQAGVRTLEDATVSELTMRAVAKVSPISERTMFRYFATRDEFLAALAAELARTLALPPHPRTIEELLAMPSALYRSFDEKRNLMKASLHSDLSDHMRAGEAKQRWIAVGKLIDAYAPRVSEQRRKIASANIRFYLSGSTWHYYRFIFRFTLDDTITCAEAAIRQSLDSLR